MCKVLKGMVDWAETRGGRGRGITEDKQESTNLGVAETKLAFHLSSTTRTSVPEYP
jgi:hypothetical protein